MLIRQQQRETAPRGHGVSETEQVFEFHQGGSAGLPGSRLIEGDVLGDTRRVRAYAVTESRAIRCACRVQDDCLKHGIYRRHPSLKQDLLWGKPARCAPTGESVAAMTRAVSAGDVTSKTRPMARERMIPWVVS